MEPYYRIVLGVQAAHHSPLVVSKESAHQVKLLLEKHESYHITTVQQEVLSPIVRASPSLWDEGGVSGAQRKYHKASRESETSLEMMMA